MQRSVWAATLLACATAQAQEAGGSSAGPSDLSPSYETRVTSYRSSPPETQSRLFAGARFWRLDPGRYEVELWWSDEHDKSGADQHLYQVEIEIGLTPHIQLDLYENLQVLPGQNLSQEGNQIEMRYSFSSQYGALWGNPTLYLEWHPRHGAPDRAEVRMLLGGNLGLPHVMAATNLYVEQNIDDRHGIAGIDGEFGAYGSASYGLLEDHVRLGVEGKLGGDEHGGPQYVLSAQLGPNLILASRSWKLTATLFFGLADRDPQLQPYVIAGYQF
jgi:hypothetical protein